MFELIETPQSHAVIKVIGVGGGGGNAVRHMIESQVEGVEFICANTDAQALKDINGATILQLGSSITKGLGAGADPEVGRQSAMEDRDRIADVLADADMVFITAGMGGGTGTGGAPVVAAVAKELGILTVAVVTKPFRLEKRSKAAEAGLIELENTVDSLITVPNEKLISVLGADCSVKMAFKKANDVLRGAVQGISDLIIRPGEMNLDFADVKTVMSEMGMAMMGTGSAKGEDRAREAANTAIRSPLLDDVQLQGARGILVNITASDDLTLGEFAEVGDIVEEFAADNATVVVGTAFDENIGDEIRVTVVATGLGEPVIAKKPMKVVDNPEPVFEAPIQTPAPNYADYDIPPGIRQSRSQNALAAEKRYESVDDVDYLDVPAFLRRQAD